MCRVEGSVGFETGFGPIWKGKIEELAGKPSGRDLKGFVFLAYEPNVVLMSHIFSIQKNAGSGSRELCTF